VQAPRQAHLRAQQFLEFHPGRLRLGRRPGRLQPAAREDEAGLVGRAAEMQGGGFAHVQLLPRGGGLRRGQLAAAGLAGRGPAGVRALEAVRHLLELLDKDFRRIDGAPGVQIVVGKADHRGAIAGRLAPKRIGRADLHRRAIDQAAVKGKLAERRAVILPGPHHRRRQRGSKPALRHPRQGVLRLGRRAAGRRGPQFRGHFEVGRRIPAQRPAEHEAVDALLAEVGDVAGDIGQRRDVRNRREFPGVAALRLGHRAQAPGAGLLPALPGALAGADGGNRVFANGRGHAAALDRHAPFADAHERNLGGKLRDNLLHPAIVPAPIPDDQLLAVAGLADAFVKGGVQLGNHLGGRTLAAARASLATAVRPAIGQVLGPADGEEARQPGNGAADGGHRRREPRAHFGHAGAQGGKVTRRHAFQTRARGKETHRAGTRLVQVEINAHPPPPGPLDQPAQIPQPRLVVLALPRIPRERREPRQDRLQPDPLHPGGGQPRQVAVGVGIQRRIQQRIPVEGKIGIAEPRGKGAGSGRSRGSPGRLR